MPSAASRSEGPPLLLSPRSESKPNMATPIATHAATPTSRLLGALLRSQPKRRFGKTPRPRRTRSHANGTSVSTLYRRIPSIVVAAALSAAERRTDVRLPFTPFGSPSMMETLRFRRAHRTPSHATAAVPTRFVSTKSEGGSGVLVSRSAEFETISCSKPYAIIVVCNAKPSAIIRIASEELAAAAAGTTRRGRIGCGIAMRRTCSTARRGRRGGTKPAGKWDSTSGYHWRTPN